MEKEIDLTGLLGDESPSLEFPSGLIGIEEWTKFVVISHPEAGPLKLLQSLEDNRFSLILANPADIDPSYRVKISASDAEALQYSGDLRLGNADDVETYCILSVQEEPFKVTANFLGPVVINWAAKLGRQIILADSSYNPRHMVAAIAQQQNGGA